MGLAALAMTLELTDESPNPDKPPEFFKLMSRLYPDRGESLFYQGLDALVERDYPRARDLFERAMATGLKTEEDLYYRYAEVLMLLDAPQSEIDAAVASWKYHFPFSKKPVPGSGESTTMSGQYGSP